MLAATNYLHGAIALTESIWYKLKILSKTLVSRAATNIRFIRIFVRIFGIRIVKSIFGICLLMCYEMYSWK